MEFNTIYPIPLDQRHGRMRDLFTLWFGCNLMILTVATGALGTTAFGLDLFWAIASNAVGMLIGAIFMALHAAQGPHLGVPQMVQTRGQFGAWGAAPVIAVIVVMYIGFVASNSVLGSQTLQFMAPALGQHGAIIAMVSVSLIPAIIGYKAIHIAARATSWLGGICLVFCLISASRLLPASGLATGHVTATGLVGCLSTRALWQIAYAPYVSDASRYLPPTKGAARSAFWASYAGTVLGSLMPMTLGAELGLIRTHGDIVHGLAAVAGRAAWPVLIVLTGSLALASAMNIYCGTLSAITVAQTFLPRWKPALVWRLAVSAILIFVSSGLAFGMHAHFLRTYMDFLDLLMVVLAPWTAVNLIDYYLVRRGAYDVASFFAPDGGIYGRFNLPALLSYGLGIAIQVPFLSTGFYTGPFARDLGRVDVSWVVGLVVTSLFYIVVARSTKTSPTPGSSRPGAPSEHRSRVHS